MRGIPRPVVLRALQLQMGQIADVAVRADSARRHGREAAAARWELELAYACMEAECAAEHLGMAPLNIWATIQDAQAQFDRAVIESGGDDAVLEALLAEALP